MMIDILLYLFEQKLVDEAINADHQVHIQQQLTLQGFGLYEINLALGWLKDLQDWCDITDAQEIAPQITGTRIWTSAELKKLTAKSLAMLVRLERQGVIDPWQREVIIDRAMAIHMPSIDVEQIKWVMLIVLYYIRLETKPMTWIEHILLQESAHQH